MPDAILFLVLYVIGFFLASVLHEGSHLVAGMLLRCDPRVICIGAGPNVGRVRYAGIWVVFRLLPIGGYVSLLPRSRERRIASFLVTAAGPSANLAALVALWTASERLPDIIVFCWLTPQALLLIGSTLPFTAKINGFPALSDGKKMLLFLMGRDRDVLADAYANIALRLQPGITPPERTTHFPEIVLQALRIDRAEAWGRRQAIDALSELSAKGTLNPLEAEATTQIIYEYVDADQAAFRKEREKARAGRGRTWRRAAASVRESWQTGKRRKRGVRCDEGPSRNGG